MSSSTSRWQQHGGARTIRPMSLDSADVLQSRTPQALMAKSVARVSELAPPRAISTATMLCGLALTGVALPGGSAEDVFSFAALGVGLSLSVATAIEVKAGIRNFLRTDVIILWVLYLLTFFEFLFPQPRVDTLISAVAAANGTHAA